MMHKRKSSTTASDNGVKHASQAALLLREIADTTNAPYMKTIAGVSLLIFETVLVSSLVLH